MSTARADEVVVVIGPLACDHRFMGGSLVGREAELDRIAGAVVSARGGTSRCLLVTGEAGIGKSRLVAEAVGSLGDALVLTGHAADMSTGEIPFGVVADTLRDLTRVAGADVLRRPSARRSPRCSPARLRGCRSSGCSCSRPSSTSSNGWPRSSPSCGSSRTCTGRTRRRATWSALAVRTLPAGLLRGHRAHRRPRADAGDEADADVVRRRAGSHAGLRGAASRRLSAAAVQQQLCDLLGSHPSADLASRVERLSDGIPFVVEELAAAAGRPELTHVAAVAAGRLAACRPRRGGCRGRCRRRRPPPDQPARAGPRRHARGARHGADRGAARRDPDDRPRARRSLVPARAAAQGDEPRDRTGRPASWHRQVGRGAGGQPGRAGADPALLAVTDALAPGARRAPALRRRSPRCRPRSGSAAPTRRSSSGSGSWALSVADDATAVTGLSLRDAYAPSALVAHMSARLPDGWRPCPRHLLRPTERRFFERELAVHGKGEMNGQAQERDRCASPTWSRTTARLPGDHHVDGPGRHDDDRSRSGAASAPGPGRGRCHWATSAPGSWWSPRTPTLQATGDFRGRPLRSVRRWSSSARSAGRLSTTSGEPRLVTGRARRARGSGRGDPPRPRPV